MSTKKVKSFPLLPIDKTRPEPKEPTKIPMPPKSK